MKLKEGIKKEDLWGTRFKVEKPTELEPLLSILKELGYCMKGLMPAYDSPFAGYVLCYPDYNKKNYYEYFPLEITPHWTVRYLSDLVEEEYPKYVRCIDAKNSWGDLKKDAIYPIIEQSEGFYTTKESSYAKYRFVPATEEEYLAYQASLNPLKQVDDELDKMEKLFSKFSKTPTDSDSLSWGVDFAKGKDTTVSEKTFAISDDQIRRLVNLFKPDTIERAVLSDDLKEWFPAASVFKKEEKTYSIGQRFRYDSNEYILASTEPARIGFVNLETGLRFADSVKAKEHWSIKEHELKEAMQGYKFTLIED